MGQSVNCGAGGADETQDLQKQLRKEGVRRRKAPSFHGDKILNGGGVQDGQAFDKQYPKSFNNSAQRSREGRKSAHKPVAAIQSKLLEYNKSNSNSMVEQRRSKYIVKTYSQQETMGRTFSIADGKPQVFEFQDGSYRNTNDDYAVLDTHGQGDVRETQSEAISDKYLGGGGDDGDGDNERADSEESDLLMNASIRIEQAFMDETRQSTDLLANDLGGTNNTKTKELLEMSQSYRFSEVHDQSVDLRQSICENRQSIIQGMSLGAEQNPRPENEKTEKNAKKTKKKDSSAGELKGIENDLNQSVYSQMLEHSVFEKFDFYNYEIQKLFQNVGQLNWPWYFQYQNQETKKMQMEIFDDVTCMMIEVQYQRYRVLMEGPREDAEDQPLQNDQEAEDECRYIRISPWSRIDLKDCVEIVDDGQGSAMTYDRFVYRGKTGVRRRSPYSSRFSESSQFHLINEKASQGGHLVPFQEQDYAWLAMEWFFQSGKRMPSRQEIIDGVLLFVMKDVIAESDKAGNVNPKHLQEAIDNRTAAWILFFRVARFSTSGGLDEPIDAEKVLSDPKNPLTQTLLYMYSMESRIPAEMNRIQLEKDADTIDTLGPLAICLESIIFSGSQSSLPNQQLVVWRGLRLPNHEIASYMQLTQTRGNVNLMGFTSATKKLPLALQSAIKPAGKSEDDADKMPAIVQITLNNPMDVFDMNSGQVSAYHSQASDNEVDLNEDEVILQDGCCLQVVSLQVQDHDQEALLLIKLAQQ